MQRQEFKHFYQDNVRWGDCDQLGHVNNTIYLQFIESARLDYFLKIMQIELTPSSIEGWVMADLSCQFKGQVHYPCALEIGTRISKVGNSSAMVECAIFRAGEDEAVFTSRVASVWCNYQQGTPVRVPSAIRALVKAHEGEVEGL